MQCEYCGSELVLVENGSAFKEKEIVPCPHCGNMLGSGRWYCSKCGYVTPEHRERVKELQTKIKFIQDERRRTISNLAEDIPADDFVMDCFIYPRSHEYVAITAHGLTVRSRKNGLEQYRWTDVVAVGNPERGHFKGAFNPPGWYFQVQTLSKPIEIWFDVPHYQTALKAHRETLNALRLHNLGKKPIGSIVLSLKTDESGQHTT
jgi:ribosomal protein S27AE